MQNLFALSPSKTKEYTQMCIQAGLVAFLQSSPGMGKSSIVKQIADEFGLQLIDCRLSTMEPCDLNGLPWFHDGKAEFQPYSFFPLEDSPVPEGKNGWILFLDEFNSASRATQAAAYKVVLDREIGMKKLHPYCAVVAAGNKMTDGAITNKLSTAMSSRVVHLNMELNFEDWRDNFALPQKIDERIIAYLSMYPEKLMEFDPDRDDQTFTCPRTWEFASKILKTTGKTPSEIVDLIAGAITGEQASSFAQFCKVYKDLVTLKDILADPETKCPKDKAGQWAILIHLSTAVDAKNIEPVLTWVDKNFDKTLAITFLRTLNASHGSEFFSIPAYCEFTQKLAKYMLN